jgi:hypothetical protein
LFWPTVSYFTHTDECGMPKPHSELACFGDYGLKRSILMGRGGCARLPQ